MDAEGIELWLAAVSYWRCKPGLASRHRRINDLLELPRSSRLSPERLVSVALIANWISLRGPIRFSYPRLLGPTRAPSS